MTSYNARVLIYSTVKGCRANRTDGCIAVENRSRIHPELHDL
jgi:hypothetical protein